MKKLFALIILTASILNLKGQSADSDTATKRIIPYSFIIIDRPALLFTMQQSNENYLSSYRLITRQINKSFGTGAGAMFQLATSLITIPLTHEEGHRAVLTKERIGSISMPYFNSKGAAYVKGVRNAELKNLRDNSLPVYIRLHTAGLESDFALLNRMEKIIAFEQDDRENFAVEYYYRKFSQVSYFFTSLFPRLEPDLEEEENELDRDIVGHDVYGAIRHLHRPNDSFYRYTKYNDFTATEKKFVQRVGWRSLANLVSPALFGFNNFKLSNSIKANFAAGYSMAPFGDYFEENFYLMFNKKLNFNIYLRQFQNRRNWFYTGGLSLDEFPLSKKFIMSVSGHIWQQPKMLDFNTTSANLGGAGDILFRYKMYKNPGETALQNISLDAGFTYKSAGFLPENMYLNEAYTARLGLTAFIK